LGLFANLTAALACIVFSDGVTGVGGLKIGSRVGELKSRYPQTKFLGRKLGLDGQYWRVSDDISVLCRNGRVVYIITGTDKFELAGIRVGDSFEKVEKIHGECFELRVTTNPRGCPEQLGLRYPRQNLLFWIGDGVVTRIVIGDIEKFRYSTKDNFAGIADNPSDQ